MKKKAELPKYRIEGQIRSIKQSGSSVFIEGFANKAIVDRAKDIIDPQAFVKNNGLDNFMKLPTILFNHGMDPVVGGLPVGKGIEVTPKEEGLFIKVKLSQSKDRPISTVRGLVEEGMLRAFSIGFNPEETVPDEEKGINVIKSAELWEVSIVGVPMNQESLFGISGKSKTDFKSLSQVAASICRGKGAGFAEKMNLAIDKQGNRSAVIDDLADASHVSQGTIKDVLSGNLLDVPNQIILGCESVLGIKYEKEKKGVGEQKEDDHKETEEEKEKKDESEEKDKKSGSEEKILVTKKTSDGDGENNHSHEAQFGDETGEGKTISMEGAGPYHDHGIEGFTTLSGGVDNHSHPGSLNSSEKQASNFQKCVNEKIPALIQEGKDQEQAVAEAISFCRKEQKCTIAPTREMYRDFFENADIAIEKRKQAEQERVDEPTEPIKTGTGDEGLGASPMLEQVKQTNILLSTMINEFKLLGDSLTGMTQEITAALREAMGKSPEGSEETSEEEGVDQTLTAEGGEDLEKRLVKTKKYLTLLNKRLNALEE